MEWNNQRGGRGVGEGGDVAMNDAIFPSPLFRPLNGTESGALIAQSVDWHVKGLIPKASITELIGAPKSSGKTTWTLNAIEAMLTGKSFLGQETSYTKVLYMTEEDKPSFMDQMFRARLLKPCEGCNHDNHLDKEGKAHLTPTHPDSFYWLHRRGEHMLSQWNWFDFSADADEFAQANEIEMIVWDTSGNWFSLPDKTEDQSGSINQVMTPMLESKARGMTHFIARHSNKSSENSATNSPFPSGRGSTQQKGNTDVSLTLQKRFAKDASTNGERQLTAEGRFGGILPFALIKYVDDAYQLIGTAPNSKAQEARALIRKYLDKPINPITRDMLVARIGDRASGSAVYRALREMEAEGEVTVPKKGAKGNPSEYALAERAPTTPNNS